MKKTIIVLFSIIILISSLSIGASATYNKEIDFESNIIYMESLDNGTVIFNKNSTQKTSPASLTKIVTAMVVLENCKNFNEIVPAPRLAIRDLDYTNSSSAAIKVGEEFSIEQLLNLMLVKSANDAANILAYHFGENGTPDAFIEKMNAYVKRIGCKNTHFVNAHGLDQENHYSTAEDLAIIVKEARKNKKFNEIINTLTIKLPPSKTRPKGNTYNTTNRLVSPHSKYYYPYAKGIKTGTTENAGCCLISTASKNGYSYLLIVMGAPYKSIVPNGEKRNFAFLESKPIYEWAFDNIKLKVVADTTNVVTSANVDLSNKKDSVILVPKEEVSALVPVNVDSAGVLIEPIKSSISKSVQAPVKKGQKIGKANVMYAGEKICEIDLVAGENIKRSFIKYIIHLFKKAFESTTAKIIGGVALLLLIFYITVNILYSRRKKRRRKFYIVDNYRNMRK